MAMMDNFIRVFFILTVVSGAAYAKKPAAAAKESTPAYDAAAAPGPGAAATHPFDITELGAVSDGKTDSTKAVQDAWDAACALEGEQKVVIPTGTFLTGPLNFSGPCKGYVTVQIDGTLLGSNDIPKYNQGSWMVILHVDNIVVNGSGTLDGQGPLVWKDECKVLPNSLVLDFVNNGTVSGIKLVNSKFFHINVYKSKDVTIKNVAITAVADSPNTDGIHIGDSSEISVADSTIGTGDDCISVGPGSEKVNIQGVTCGPGQGISIGCLGRFKDEKDVTDVTVRNCVLRNTTNGVRIKSYEDVLSPITASKLTFENIRMEDVANPVIVDQKYCPEKTCSDKKGNNTVTIKDIVFRNITGTSSTPEAVSLLCSDQLPCSGMELLDVNVEYAGRDNKTMAVCTNAKGYSKGSLAALACL
uniref:Exopolygalacturonase n=1 Tax=Leersia perrieri TaxID=77586 RepID=A0A0D9V1K4_9ORYZ